MAKQVAKTKAVMKKERGGNVKASSRNALGGRPTKYTTDIPQRLLDFFSIEPYRVEMKDSGRMACIPARFPTLARFAAENGICRDTLHRWANEKDADGNILRPEFSDAYKRAKDLQEANLVEGAMAGAYPPAFSIFTAKNVLGWRDRQEVEHSSDPIGSLLAAIEGTTKGLPSGKDGGR